MNYFITIRHSSLLKKRAFLEDLNMTQLKEYLDYYKIPFKRSLSKSKLIDIALRKT